MNLTSVILNNEINHYSELARKHANVEKMESVILKNIILDSVIFKKNISLSM